MRHHATLHASDDRRIALSCSCEAWIELPDRCSLELAADILRQHERDVDVATERAHRDLAEQYRRAVETATELPLE